MGILACDRNGCDNIMCSRYSNYFGYICYDCFQELRDTKNVLTIGDFMQSEKKPHLEESSWEDYINKEFQYAL